MMSRASRNFKEVSSIIRKIEALFRLHEIGAFVAGDKLLPDAEMAGKLTARNVNYRTIFR